MSRRKPTRPPTRRPSSHHKPKPQTVFPWSWAIGIAATLILFAAAGLFLRSRTNTAPTSSTVANPSPTTPVTATAQPAAVSAATTISSTAVPPTSLPNLPEIETAVTINIQRDEDVDPITGVASWSEPANRSEISVRLRLADGEPVNEYIYIYTQTEDVSGNPAYGDRKINRPSGDTGILTEGIPPDTYILDFNADGWPWIDQFANHTVQSNQRTNILFDFSLLTVGVRNADGMPVNDYVYIYQQESDVSGQPVEGKRVGSSSAGDDGLITFALTPGAYAISIPDLDGYDDWGRFNHQVPGGGIYTVTLTLGQIVVETWNPDGSLATNTYAGIYTLSQDATGNSILGQRIASQHSGNTGKAVFDLTPGLYGVAYDDAEFVNIPVQPGQITTVHQTGYTESLNQ